MVLFDHRLVLETDGSFLNFSTHKLIRVLSQRYNYFLPTLSNNIIYLNLNNNVLLVAENTDLNRQLFINNTPKYDNINKTYFLYFDIDTELQNKISELGSSKVISAPVSNALNDVNAVLSSELNCFLYDVTEISYIDLDTEQHIKGNKIFNHLELLSAETEDGKFLFLDDNNQIKPYPKKISELSSSSLVKLTSDTFYANGSNKILFDDVIQNINNFYIPPPSAQLVINNDNSLYAISGVICVYSTTLADIPKDISLSISVNNVSIVKIVNTIYNSNNLYNLPFNLSLRFNENDTIHVELEGNSICISSKFSYLNGALINII